MRDARGGRYGRSAERSFSTRAEGRTIKGPTFMELFAGIGGFGVAAREHGYSCVYANENNKFNVETYERNHCRGGPGILKVDNRDIEEVIKCIMSRPSSPVPRATILFAGFPCQSFSKQGKQEGLDSKEYGHFLYDIMKFLIHLRNPIVMLENVKEFATNEKFEAMKVVHEEFEALGYYVSTHIYNTVDFNLAQHRERLFIVAVRKDLATCPFECASVPCAVFIPVQTAGRSEGISSRLSFGPAESIPDRENTHTGCLLALQPVRSSSITNIITIVKKPPGRRQDLPLTDFLDPSRPVENRGQYTRINGVEVPNWAIKGKKAELKWTSGTLEERTSSQGLKEVGLWVEQGQTEGCDYGRRVFHHSGFAACITTRLGNWYQVPGPYGTGDIIRQLSLREALRLQGFPEGFELCERAYQAWRQIGNSVAPPIASWILRCLRDQYPHILESDTYSTTEVWPQVQAPERSPEDQSLIHQQLKNLETRRKDSQKRREAQKALKEMMGQANGTRPGAGKTTATNTKRLSKSDEEEISVALKTKLRISSGEMTGPKSDDE